jgi:hypothetical protein
MIFVVITLVSRMDIDGIERIGSNTRVLCDLYFSSTLRV